MGWGNYARHITDHRCGRDRCARFCIVVTEDQGSSVAILRPDGALVARIDVRSWPHELEVDATGRTVFATQFGITDYDSKLGTPGDHISRIDLDSARETGRIMLPDGRRAPHGVKLRPGKEELFINTEAGGDVMLVYDSGTLTLLRQFALPSETHNFIFSTDGSKLYSFAGVGGVTCFDPVSGRIVAQLALKTPVRGLRLAADGLVVAAGKGELALLDPDTLEVRKLMKSPVPGQMLYIETLGDGTIVAPSLSDNGVIWFGKGEARFVATGKGALTARRGPDGMIYVTNVEDDHLTKLDRDGRILGSVGTGLTGPNSLGFGVCPNETKAGANGPERG